MRSNFMIVPADPNTPLPSVHDKEDKPMDTDKVSYWLPRHEFTRIMKEVAEEESLNFQTQKSKNTETSHGVGSLSLLFGMECLDVLPSAPGDVHGATSNGVDILLKNITSNHVSTVRCTLAVGADGYKSLVCYHSTVDFDFTGTGLWLIIENAFSASVHPRYEIVLEILTIKTTNSVLVNYGQLCLLQSFK
jgi:2-polyprenyl-6-methoxyphenol hydroxylase-like FAD-dependent oxidoreductase